MGGTQPPVLHRRAPVWQRLIVLALLSGAGFLVIVVALGAGLAGLFQRSWFQEWVFTHAFTQPWNKPNGPPAPPRVPYIPVVPESDASRLTQASDLFIPTNLWTTHLHFTAAQWDAIQPQSVPRLRGWLGKDGTPKLSNTNAPRPGLTGVFGVAQPWSTATFEFGNLSFTNVAVRFKGNGTFLFARDAYSRPFKIELSKHVPGRTFAGQSELNLHNLTADPSFVSDALGYEFFRDAGVPASRTTYTRPFLSIDGRWERQLLGLYAIVEDPGESWLAESLKAPGGSLFKPVTLELFLDLGDDWNAYTTIYNPKSKIPEAHRRLLIDLCRLVTHADDAEFARRIFEFIDLGHLGRFLACETLLSNYDGIFSNGQNFLLWIDPNLNRFGFSPWDLDQSWGQFSMIGTTEQRIRAPVFHPWVGPHRFFERVFAVPEFQARYRAELTRLLDTVFVPERLHQRIDTFAHAIRPAVAGLPDDRTQAFENAVADAGASSTSSPARHQGRSHGLKSFITRRAAEVRAQLNGTSEGLRVTRETR